MDFKVTIIMFIALHYFIVFLFEKFVSKNFFWKALHLVKLFILLCELSREEKFFMDGTLIKLYTVHKIAILSTHPSNTFFCILIECQSISNVKFGQ